MLAPGAPLPDLALRALAGPERRLRALFPGRPGLLLVGHGECATTRFVLPFAQRLSERCPTAESVAVALEDGDLAAWELVAELRLALPIMLDPPPHACSRALGVETVPSLFSIDADGRVAAGHVGFQRAALEEAARTLGVAAPLFGSGDAVPALRPG